MSDTAAIPLPPEVFSLLADKVDTFERVELVVALHRARRRTLPVDALSQAVRATRDVVRSAATGLVGIGLVELTDRGEVRLRSTPDDAAIDELVRIYESDQVLVVRVLGDIAIDRIRRLLRISLRPRTGSS